MIRTILTFCLLFIVSLSSTVAEEPFRTDGGDESLPWFQLVKGEFPPAGSAHYFAGELIGVDHINRSFIVRNDRTDKQRRSHWDLPVGATMLPYGSVYYHGAPASLADIPLGTHLHGQFYLKDPDDKSKPLEGWHNRVSNESDFRRCFQLEDDFSYYARQQQVWRIDDVDLNEKKLTATLQHAGESIGDAKIFDLLDSTRVWQGNQIKSLADLTAGQTILFNITWATLYGPGRLVEIWADDASRQLATERQLKRHHQYILNRGLPGRVVAVDNQERIVTVTFFGNVDPKLVEKVSKGASAATAVAKTNLRTYDPVNDRKHGSILSVKTIPVEPGSSGVQAEIRPDLLLEGFRPGRIVRVYPPGFTMVALPKEEEFFGRD
ncbi:MAG: hypothetical protein NXI22_01750 [bacterium]|nr:hypothetical protein [bacterium]